MQQREESIVFAFPFLLAGDHEGLKKGGQGGGQEKKKQEEEEEDKEEEEEEEEEVRRHKAKVQRAICAGKTRTPLRMWGKPRCAMGWVTSQFPSARLFLFDQPLGTQADRQVTRQSIRQAGRQAGRRTGRQALSHETKERDANYACTPRL